MSTHPADADRAGSVPQAALAADRTNEAVGLKAYLDGVAAQVKTVPAAWVRCELLTLKPSNKFVRMESVEHDATGKKLA
jgi:exodeoxyribonuclease VII large subunit